MYNPGQTYAEYIAARNAPSQAEAPEQPEFSEYAKYMASRRDSLQGAESLHVEPPSQVQPHSQAKPLSHSEPSSQAEREYKLIMSAVLADGRVDPTERALLTEFAAEHGISEAQHELILNQAGWSRADYDYGAKLLTAPAEIIRPSEHDILDISAIEISELGYSMVPSGTFINPQSALTDAAAKAAQATITRVTLAATTSYVTAATNAATAVASKAAATAATTAVSTATAYASTAATAAGTTAANLAAKAAAGAMLPAASTAAPAASAALAAAVAAASVAVAPAATAAAAAGAAFATAAAPLATALAPISAALAPAASATATAATSATAAAGAATIAAAPSAAAAATAATAAAAAAAVSKIENGALETGLSAAVASLKPASFVGDAWTALCSEVMEKGAKVTKQHGSLSTASEVAVCEGVYISSSSGAPLFSHAHAAGIGPEGLYAFSVPSDVPSDASRDSGACMLQHVRSTTDVSSGSPRTELIDATSGARIGYALGRAGSMEPSGGPLQAKDAQLLLVDEPAVLLVPRGEPPPVNVPLPAAPVIRRLIERAPEWMGSAYVVTLAGGPRLELRAALTMVPGVLEVTTGYTRLRSTTQGVATAEEVHMGELGLVEAVQLAVEPSVKLETLLEAYWGSHHPTSHRTDGDGTQPTSCIFYHSSAQREAALAARAREELMRGQPLLTSIRPATSFLEAGIEEFLGSTSIEQVQTTTEPVQL